MKNERIIEGEYATIYELCLHETTTIQTSHTPGKNSYGIFEHEIHVTRLHGGWVYSRYAGTKGPMEHFVPDTRNAATQHSANLPRK